MKQALPILLVFCILAFPVAAEDGGEAEQKDAFIIRDVSYEIDGRTKEKVLAHVLEMREETRFATRQALQTYLADKEQVIANQRTLDSGEIIVSYERSADDPEVTYVDLQVRVEDTWNLVLLPYAEYDSNKGLEVSLKGRDFNFLGSMNELVLNFDYLIRDLAKDSDYGGFDFSTVTSFELPFYAYGLDWHVGFKGDITYNAEEVAKVTTSGAPLQANTELTLGMDVPLEYYTWKTELIQEYHLNEDGLDDPDTYYYRTTLRFGNSIPTGLMLPLSEEITYTPYIFTAFSYKPGDTLSRDRRGYELGFQHSISAGRVDWMGNFREGTDVSLSNTVKWNFTRARWLGSLSGSYQYHTQWGWGGLSSRAGFFYEHGDVKEDAGDVIRGILNNRIDDELALYTNVDLPFDMWIWFLDRWFEGHLSPFFDYAVTSPDDGGLDFSKAWYGAGLEAFAYAKFARSLYLRISVGFDMEAVFEDGVIGNAADRDGATPYEIFIGLGHHY